MKKHASMAATLLLSLVLAFAAISVSHAAPEDDIEALFNAAVEEWNAGDTDAFASHFTAEGLAYQFDGVEPAEAQEAVAGAREEIGKMTAATITDIEVDGGDASAAVEITFESGYELFEEWEFLLENVVWLIGPGSPLYRPIPAGVPAVDMTLQEYAFVYDQAALTSGNFGFNVTNQGQQDHEVVIVGLEDGAALSDVVDSVEETGELPAEAELVLFGGIFEPGTTGTAILPERLEPGRYALVCFLPSPDGIAHAVLGMQAEFTVDSEAGVSAPNTGDAGLADPSSDGRVNGLLVGLTLAVTVAVLAVSVKTRRSSRAS
jgi:hypothetical protein